MIRVQRSLAVLLLVSAVAPLLNAQTFTKPPGTVSVYVTGPSWLNVGSDVPARMWVIWQPLRDASGYRISRSTGSGAPAPQQMLASSDVYAAEPYPAVKYPHELPSDDSLTLFNFQVHAFFVNGIDTTWSGPSPVSSARSVPNRPPANLRYTTSLSRLRPGLLRVDVSWDKWYTGVAGYKLRIWAGGTLVKEYSAITQTAVIIDDYRVTTESIGQIAYQVRRGDNVVICVCTRWPTKTAPFSPWACTPAI